MKGDPDIIAKLGEILTDELTSANMYLYFSRRLADQGYGRLYARLAHEAEDEMRHAQMVVERIVLLGGEPNVLRRKDKATPQDAKGMLQASLDYEYEVSKTLNDAIALCDERKDAGSRQILDQLLRDTEEDHIDWLESQLFLIEQVGLERYLAQQMGAAEVPDHG